MITKRKWVITRNKPPLASEIYYIQSDPHTIVAQIGAEWKDAEANAHLIAAAPDMYEALKELSTIVLGVIEYHKNTPVILGMDSFTLQPAKEALAEAEEKC